MSQPMNHSETPSVSNNHIAKESRRPDLFSGSRSGRSISLYSVHTLFSSDGISADFGDSQLFARRAHLLYQMLQAQAC